MVKSKTKLFTVLGVSAVLLVGCRRGTSSPDVYRIPNPSLSYAK